MSMKCDTEAAKILDGLWQKVKKMQNVLKRLKNPKRGKCILCDGTVMCITTLSL